MSGCSILGNAIFSNRGLGIDLGNQDGPTLNDPLDTDTGPNNRQNFPVLTSVSRTGSDTTITGTLNSTPGTSFTLEFFSNVTSNPSGFGEGRTFLGRTKVTTDGNGAAPFSVTFPVLVPAGQFISATATDPQGSTSEFSRCAPGIIVTPTTSATPFGGTTTTESGGTATFTVVLGSVPTGNVTIGLSSSNLAEGTVAPTSLTFTPANALTPQTVTVTGVDDLVMDGDIAYSIVTAAAVSTDDSYNGLDPADVSVSNLDNDTPGVRVGPVSGLVTTESGGTAIFSVALKSIPTGNVTIGLSSSNPAEGTVAPTSLTFTPANALTPQMVTITGVDNGVASGSGFYSILTAPAVSTDPNYNNLDPDDVNVINEDNDAGTIVVTPTSGLMTTESGGTATFTVALSAAPTSNVNVSVRSSDNMEGTVSPATLTFTPANGTRPQTVTITGVDDSTIDGDIFYFIAVSATSSDTRFNFISGPDVAVRNLDNDSAILVTPASGLLGTTESGGTATFTVALKSVPTGNVTIGLSSSNPAEGTVSPASLTFTPGNALTPQTVTVTGANDAMLDGDIAYSIITAPAVSTDATYNGLNPADVSVINRHRGITITPTSGLTTTESGGTDTFTVALKTVPTGNVTIGLSSSNLAEGTVAPTSLTFTPANALMPQTVTVTGVDDLVVDGNIIYTIVTAPAVSSDPRYNGLDPADVSVTNLDDDAPIYTFEVPQFAVGQTTPILAALPNSGPPTISTSFTATSGPADAFSISNTALNPLMLGQFLFEPSSTSGLTLAFSSPVTRLSVDFAINVPFPSPPASFQVTTPVGGTTVAGTTFFGSAQGGTLTFTSTTPFSTAQLFAFDFFGAAAALGIDNLNLTPAVTPVSWISATSGFWDDATNWSGGAVPTATDDVTINQSGVTVTVRDSRSVRSLVKLSDSLVINTGATLMIESGISRINTGGISGAGNVEFASGTTAFANGTIYNVTGGTTVDGGTVNFNAGSSVAAAGALTISSGMVNFSTGAGVSVGTLTESGGSLTGSDAVTVSGLLTWTGGTMAGSGATVAEANTALSGGGNETLDSRTLNNFGVATWGGANNSIILRNGAAWNNEPGSVLDSQADNQNLSAGSGAASVFNNQGTFTKSAGTGATTIGVALENNGSVLVQSGTLSLTGGGNGTGSFSVAANTTLAFDAGTYSWNAGTTDTGQGQVRIAAATVTTSGNVSMARLTLTGGTLAAMGDLTVSSIYTQSSGTLAGTGTVTLAGLTTWTGGTMAGSGATVAQGNMAISGGNIELDDGRSVNNYATAIWTAANHSINLANGAIWNNEPGSVLDSQADNQNLSAGSGAASVFNNQGTFTKSAGTGNTTISVPLTNSGSVQVESGTVSVTGGGNSTGSFSVAANTTLSFDGSLYSWNAGTAGTGPGQVRITAGTVTASGNVSLTNLTLSGGTVILYGNLTLSDTYTLSGGYLTGGTVTVAGLMSWTSGIMAGGTTVARGNIAISGGGTKELQGGTLDNYGTATWTGANDVIYLRDDLIWNNEPGSVLDSQADGQQLYFASGWSTPAFNNQGTLKKSAGTGTTTISVPLTNSGSVQVQSGTLRLTGGGNSTGSFSVSANATLAFDGGTLASGTGSVLSGAGTAEFGNGTANFTSGATYNLTGNTTVAGASVNFNSGSGVLAIGALTISSGTASFSSGAAVNATALALSGGTLTGSDTVTISGRTTWTSGTMSGTGITNVQGALQLGAPDTTTRLQALDRRTFNNAGAATWVGSNDSFDQQNASVFNNLAGGSLSIQNSGSWLNDQNNSIFNNQGAVSKSAGNGTTSFSVAFNNSGLLSVSSGVLALNSTVAQVSGTTLAGGTWSIGAAGTLSFGGASNITTNAANVTLDGANSTFQALDSLTNNTGSLSILNGRIFTVGGHLQNSGSLLIGAGDILTVSGNYTQSATGALTIQIASDPSAGQFSQLKVNGSATLDGTLNVQLTNGYGPLSGLLYSIVIVNAASTSGTFATVNGLTFGRFTLFSINYAATGVTLTSLIGAPDLAVSSITLPNPATGIDGQNLTIDASVQNVGMTTATGQWVDSIYLTTNSVMDSSAVLLGRVNHSSDVAGGTIYSDTLTAPIPGLLPGNYHVAVICDSRGLVPDLTRVNNTLISASTILMSVATLALGLKQAKAARPSGEIL